MFDLDSILKLIAIIGPSIAVYVGIKTDLAVTHEKAVIAYNRADDAHERIDNLLKGNK